MDIKIIKAQKHHLYAAADILNRATAKLIEKGVMQWEYPWDHSEILSYIDKQEFFIAYIEDSHRGCVGLKDFRENTFNPGDKKGLYLYHLAVHPHYSGKGLGSAICRWVKEYAAQTDRTIYFDCWRGNKTLIDFYTKNGFVSLGEFPEEDYFIHAFRTV